MRLEGPLRVRRPVSVRSRARQEICVAPRRREWLGGGERGENAGEAAKGARTLRGRQRGKEQTASGRGETGATIESRRPKSPMRSQSANSQR